jgi:hypothetical protein
MNRNPIDGIWAAALRLFGLARSLCTDAACLTAFATLGGTLGCSGPLEREDVTPVAVASEALRDSNYPSSIGFKYWSALPTLGNTAGDPTITNGNTHLFIAMQKGSGNGHYWGISCEGPEGGAWVKYDDTRSFASSPAIAHLPNASTGDRRIMVVGRGAGSASTDRRIFWSTGRVSTATTPPPLFVAPVKTTSFLPVSDDTFNDPYGYPAIASSPSGDTYVTYIGSDSRVYGHFKAGGTLQWTRVQGPALPSGWVPDGVPAITWGYLNMATIVVRAKKSGSADRLYRLFFTGSLFHDPLGPAVWKELQLPSGSMAIQSNPGLEWDDEIGYHTVYYRNDKAIYEASFVYDTLVEIPQKIVATTTPELTGSPAVTGNVQYEHGNHWVLARDKNDSSKLWFSESHPNSNMTP